MPETAIAGDPLLSLLADSPPVTPRARRHQRSGCGQRHTGKFDQILLPAGLRFRSILPFGLVTTAGWRKNLERIAVSLAGSRLLPGFHHPQWLGQIRVIASETLLDHRAESGKKLQGFPLGEKPEKRYQVQPGRSHPPVVSQPAFKALDNWRLRHRSVLLGHGIMLIASTCSPTANLASPGKTARYPGQAKTDSLRQLDQRVFWRTGWRFIIGGAGHLGRGHGPMRRMIGGNRPDALHALFGTRKMKE